MSKSRPISPFGDDESLEKYFKAIHSYYKDAKQFVSNKKIIWYTNFIQPNIYVVVLDAIRLMQQYDKRNHQSPTIDVQTIFQKVLDLNNSNFNIDKNVENLANMIKSIPVNNAELTWKVKNEYARTINGMSKTFVSNLESCTNKQKSVYQEFTNSKKQLKSLQSHIYSMLDKSITMEYQTFGDLLEAISKYVNFSINIIPFGELTKIKMEYEKQQQLNNSLLNNIPLYYLWFIERFADNIRKLRNTVICPQLSDLDIQDVLNFHDLIVKFIITLSTKTTNPTHGINVQKDKLIHLKDFLVNTKEYYTVLERENENLKIQNTQLQVDGKKTIQYEQEEKEKLKNEYSNELNHYRKLMGNLEQELHQNRQIQIEIRDKIENIQRERDDIYRQNGELQKKMENCAEEVERNQHAYTREVEKYRIKCNELIEKSHLQNTRIDELQGKCEELKREKLECVKRNETYEQQMKEDESKNHKMQQLQQIEIERKNELYRENFQQQIAVYVEKMRQDEEKFQQKISMYEQQMQQDREKISVYELQIQQIRNEYQQQIETCTQEIQTLMTANANLHSMINQNNHIQYMENQRLTAVAAEKCTYCSSFVVIFNNSIPLKNFEQYLQMTDEIYKLMLPQIDESNQNRQFIENIPKRINYKYILDFNEEAQQISTTVTNRKDLITLIVNYGFLNYQILEMSTKPKKPITMKKLRIEMFRNVMENGMQHFSSSSSSTSFIDYFLESFLENSHLIVQDRKNLLAIHLFQKYFVYVAEREQMLDILNTTSLKLTLSVE